MDSVSVRVLVVATFAAFLVGCKSDSPLEPLDRASTIQAISAVDFAGVVGTVANPAPIVRVIDDDGHGVADVLVSFAVTAGGGSVLPSVARTDADGRATATWTLGSAASTNTLKVSLGTLEPVLFNASARAGPAAALEHMSAESQIAAVGSVAASPPKVRVVDSFHNPVAGVSVSFTVIAGGGTVTSANPVSDAAGLVTASWTIGAVEGVQSVRAQIAAGATILFNADTFICPGASSTPCTGIGELIFVRISDHQIYRINVDGTGQAKLTSEGSHGSPVWSPDGKRIAFIRFTTVTGGPGTSDVYLMNPDGSNVVRRTQGGQYNSLAWSPDGQTLVVDGAFGGDSLNIFTLSADPSGSAPTILKTNAASPSWSPDGTKILYAHGTGYYDAAQIYVMNADGTGAHRATPDSSGFNWDPAWSPDGQNISFMRCNFGCAVYKMNVSTPAVTSVTSGTSNAGDASWSPDGKWLALSLFGSSQSINYVPVAGGIPRLILAGAFAPSWKPRTP